MCSVQVNEDEISVDGIIRVVKQSPVSIVMAVALKVKHDELYETHCCPDSDVGFVHIKGEVKKTGKPFNAVVAREQDVFRGRFMVPRIILSKLSEIDRFFYSV